jgi:hypothetical protein
MMAYAIADDTARRWPKLHLLVDLSSERRTLRVPNASCIASSGRSGSPAIPAENISALETGCCLDLKKSFS